MKRQIACKKDAIEAVSTFLKGLSRLDGEFLDHVEALDGIFICRDHDDEWDDFEENLHDLEGLLVMITSTVRRIPR